MSKIPKYIHYCWFGNKPIPKQLQRYIETWKKYMPEYEIILWNEKNFDVNSFQYTKEAYEAKKYAFVSDVARIYALNKMGGIYLDADVEVIKPLDTLFGDFNAILGTESEVAIGTGFLAFAPNHKICRDFLSYYKHESFLGQTKVLANTVLLQMYIEDKYHIDPPKEITKFDGDVIIYPYDYFTAYNQELGITEVTSNTVCIHHFKASWVRPTLRWKLNIKKALLRLIKS